MLRLKDRRVPGKLRWVLVHERAIADVRSNMHWCVHGGMRTAV
jgi:hypothetical protein